jgi:4-amino-4-deoxy-L-arabinose transferase-like glycosyltransferase
LLLVVICCAVMLPGLWAIAPIDRDEARFAQASRQMLESGDWVIPMVQDRPRLNKPPLVYWLQASSAWVLSGGDVSRDAIWMYRVPGVLCAIGAVLLTWRLGTSMGGASVGFLAGSMLAVSPLVAFDAHQARADQLLLLCTTWAMSAWWSIWRRHRRGERVGIGVVLSFWLAISAGVLTKGPITPLVVGLAVGALAVVGSSWGFVRATRPLLGGMLVAVVVGPWVLAVASKVGFAEYAGLVWRESAGRAGGSTEGHFGPPGLHALLLVVLLWPGSVVVARAVVESVHRGWPARAEVAGSAWWRRALARRLGRPADAFLLAWALPAWVFFELFGAKLAHYPMPLYPAIAILAARGACLLDGRGVTPTRFDLVVWRGVGLLVALGVGVVGALSWRSGLAEGGVSVALASGAITLVLWKVPARRVYETLIRRGRWAMGLSLAGFFAVSSGVLPGEESARIMRAAEGLWTPERPIASTHRQDSMVFWTRGRVARLKADELAAWFKGNPGGLAIVRESELQSVLVPLGVRLVQRVPENQIYADLGLDGLHATGERTWCLVELPTAPTTGL